jgi:phenylalanyl-tRNA synthetase beta chain
LAVNSGYQSVIDKKRKLIILMVMRVSVKWLQELVATKKTPQQLADLFVSRGLGIENILRIGKGLEKTLVGEVIGTDANEIVISIGKAEHKITISNLQNLPKINDKVVFNPKTKQLITKNEIGLEGNEIIILPKETIPGEKASLYLDDYILDFEIAPNRGDLMGIYGIARELACYLKKDLNLPKELFAENAISIGDKVSLDVIDKSGCPDYIARLILDAKITPSPFWLQWRIHACGLRPVNNVVDVSNYILFKYGQPLHTFDYDKLLGKKIVVRRAQNNEKIRTIDGIDRNLNDSVLMIADQNRSVAIAGIMGGIDTEISIATRNVLLECARFNPIIIRKGSQYLKLATEASRRFEMGIDPENLENASCEAAAMIAKYSQGKFCQDKVDFRTPVEEKTTKISPVRVNTLLGVKLNKRRTKQILNSLGFKVEENDSYWQVRIPSYRPDVLRDADLIEEIGRVYGYGNLSSRFELKGAEPGRRNPISQNLDKIREVLNEYGFNEIYTVSFTDEATAQLFYSGSLTKIPNPLNERFSVLRPMLLPTILDVVNLNFRKGNKNLRLFEIGRVYFDDQDPKETTCLGGIMTGEQLPIHWENKPTSVNYYDLKAALETLVKNRRWSDISFVNMNHKFLKLQDATAVRIGDTEIGFIGTLSKELNDRYELDQVVFAFEIDLDRVEQLTQKGKLFEPLPRFPSVIRDFAFVIDKEVTAAEVEKKIWHYSNELLERVEIFDCFSGGPLSTGKKNLGVRLILRAIDRTLMDEEVNQIFNQILTGLKQDLIVNLRGE